MKKVAIVGYIHLGCHLTHETLFVEDKEVMKISEVPRFDYYEPTKAEIMQLPQKVKHRKKRKFHN